MGSGDGVSGSGPGRTGSPRVRWSGLGATLGALLGVVGGWGRGGTGFPAEPARPDSAPECGGQRFFAPARQGWGLAREGRWRCPRRRHSFQSLPAPPPAAARNGFQEFGSGGTRTRIARCSPFAGLSEEMEPGKVRRESDADLGLEMLQRWHLQWFTVKDAFDFGASVPGMLGKGRLGRGRWLHNSCAQRVLMD